MTKQEIFDHVTKHGSISIGRFSLDEYAHIKELMNEKLILCCSGIPHCNRMINPDYTYVSNDERGYKLALQPLYTLFM